MRLHCKSLTSACEVNLGNMGLLLLRGLFPGSLDSQTAALDLFDRELPNFHPPQRSHENPGAGAHGPVILKRFKKFKTRALAELELAKLEASIGGLQSHWLDAAMAF